MVWKLSRLKRHYSFNNSSADEMKPDYFCHLLLVSYMYTTFI